MWDLKVNTNKAFLCSKTERHRYKKRKLVFSSGEGEKRKDTIKGMKLECQLC